MPLHIFIAFIILPLLLYETCQELAVAYSYKPIASKVVL